MYWTSSAGVTLWLEGHGQRTEVWELLASGDPVGFMSFYRVEGRPVLGEIELRPDYRGFGLSANFVALVEEFLSESLWTAGDFTPAGAGALGFMPVLPGLTPEVKYSPMTFVESWTSMKVAH